MRHLLRTIRTAILAYRNRDHQGFNIQLLLLVICLPILISDIWEVATGNVDMNRHWPFLMPAYLIFWIGFVHVFVNMCKKLDAIREYKAKHGLPPAPPSHDFD